MQWLRSNARDDVSNSLTEVWQPAGEHCYTRVTRRARFRAWWRPAARARASCSRLRRRRPRRPPTARRRPPRRQRQALKQARRAPASGLSAAHPRIALQVVCRAILGRCGMLSRILVALSRGTFVALWPSQAPYGGECKAIAALVWEAGVPLAPTRPLAPCSARHQQPCALEPSWTKAVSLSLQGRARTRLRPQRPAAPACSSSKARPAAATCCSTSGMTLEGSSAPRLRHARPPSLRRPCLPHTGRLAGLHVTDNISCQCMAWNAGCATDSVGTTAS